jgi:hypothetical protein
VGFDDIHAYAAAGEIGDCLRGREARLEDQVDGFAVVLFLLLRQA